MSQQQAVGEQIRTLVAAGAVEAAAQRAFLEIHAAQATPATTIGAVHFVGLAVRYGTQGDHAAALESFDAALDLLARDDPTDDLRPRLYQNVASALALAGDHAGAAQCLEAAIELGAAGSPVWHALGTARLQAGDAAAALEALQHAHRLKPSAAMTADLALASLGLDDSVPAARRELARLSASRPDITPVRWEYALARAYQAAGDDAQARAAYQRALERVDGELAPAEHDHARKFVRPAADR